MRCLPTCVGRCKIHVDCEIYLMLSRYQCHNEDYGLQHNLSWRCSLSVTSKKDMGCGPVTSEIVCDLISM